MAQPGSPATTQPTAASQAAAIATRRLDGSRPSLGRPGARWGRRFSFTRAPTADRRSVDQQGRAGDATQAAKELQRAVEIDPRYADANYHLGKVLHTGRDFAILDFGGEPSRTLGERRLKRSPLIDVAGMLRSFDYAAVSALIDGRVRPEDVETLRPWAEEWRRWVSRAFIDAYRQTAEPSGFLPRSEGDLRLLLDCFRLEKALHEVAFELNHRPLWTWIPLHGIRALLDGAGTEG